jgi:RNA polymerase sigma-70 factor (ECF subfamily)
MLRLRDQDRAAEAVQECFLAALNARERFAARSSERTWLIGILKRKVIDHLRRATRDRPVEDPPAGEGTEEVFFTSGGKWKAASHRWGGDPRGHAENREFWETFQRCLKDLPSALAEAFLLRELDQVGSEEVCQVLDLSPTNLWTRLHRARLSLRRCLEVHWFGRRKEGS